ncbi:hypothetical protein [Pandoraea sp.]|uniref:hypothetical protein n=1 Tax=Pandoraea sp. TaxID=1883445 RepID=UPI0035B275F6
MTIKSSPCSYIAQTQYAKMRDECAIVSSSDSKHSPYLANAIASLKINFPDHPRIIIYDIGLTKAEKHEFRSIDGVELRETPAFIPHWRLNWSWKLHTLTNNLPRYSLYLDLPNFVVMRSLAPLFCSIKASGYLLVSNGQFLREITPSDYWKFYELDSEIFKNSITFGAGIIGFDSSSNAREAIFRALNDVILGLNLGRSACEANKNYKPNIIRDCTCFRADQTLLNLAFRKEFGEKLVIRKPAPICGFGKSNDHPGQYLWYARRSVESLRYIYENTGRSKLCFLVNRCLWLLRITSRIFAKKIVFSIKPKSSSGAKNIL